MSAQTADDFAERFLTQLSSTAARFMTNLGPIKDFERPSSTSSTPMTNATLDAGIICMENRIAACIWFEDED